MKNSQYLSALKIRKIFQSITITKTKVTVALCIFIIIAVVIYQYYNYITIKSTYEDLLFQTNRFATVKNKTREIQQKILNEKRKLLNLEKRILKIDSEALAFAKIQTFFGKLANNFSITLENVRLLRTQKEDNGIMKTTVYVSCSGHPKKIIEFIDAVEKDLSKQGIIIKEINMHQKRKRTKNKTSYTIRALLKVDIVWSKGGK